MPHIHLKNSAPGIIGPMMDYPRTAKALNAIAEVLLSQDSPGLSRADRETIASYVSFLNECQFCSLSHAAVANVHWEKPGFAEEIWKNPNGKAPSTLLKALLAIAGQVRHSGKAVTDEAIAAARSSGATDEDIHDTVLIAAAFCMFNRYVDGLATLAPPAGSPAYVEIGQMLARKGYERSLES